MPALARDPLRGRVGVDRQDLRVALGRVRGRVDVELAEPAPQRLLRVEVQARLVAEEQDLVLQQRVVELLELLVSRAGGRGRRRTPPRRCAA